MAYQDEHLGFKWFDSFEEAERAAVKEWDVPGVFSPMVVIYDEFDNKLMVFGGGHGNVEDHRMRHGLIKDVTKNYKSNVHYVHF